jgi:hypothetical protein
MGKAWKAAKRFGRGAVVIAGIAYVGTGVYAVTRQYKTFQEVGDSMGGGAAFPSAALQPYPTPTDPNRPRQYVTLPGAFYLEMDFEGASLVERARSDPLALLQGGAAQLELAKALEVGFFLGGGVSQWDSTVIGCQRASA